MRKKLEISLKYCKNVGIRDEYLALVEFLESKHTRAFENVRLSYPIFVYTNDLEVSLVNLKRSKSKVDVCIKMADRVLNCSKKSFNGKSPTLINEIRKVCWLLNENSNFSRLANSLVASLKEKQNLKLADLDCDLDMVYEFVLFIFSGKGYQQRKVQGRMQYHNRH